MFVICSLEYKTFILCYKRIVCTSTKAVCVLKTGCHSVVSITREIGEFWKKSLLHSAIKVTVVNLEIRTVLRRRII
jgi:hypothetical protein